MIIQGRVPRREWIQLCAGLLSLPATLDAVSWATQPALNVRRFGAKGDGRTDDTAAFQVAIDAAATQRAAVTVPRGSYRIDAVRGVQLRDRTDLRMQRGAILVAIPNAATNYAVLRGVSVQGVRIRGGRIMGERSEHLGTDGEWGMGIDLRGCTDVVLERVTVEECWGDGFYIGHSTPGGVPGGECHSVTMRNCRALRNRRQGASIVGCIGGLIEGCEFSDTGGHSPECGIDLEPNARKIVSDVIVRRCRMTGNVGWGGVIWGAGTTRSSFEDCVVVGNVRGGLYVFGGQGNAFRRNHIHVQDGPAIGADSTASGTTVEGNTCRRAAGSGPSRKPLLDVDSRRNRLGTNACTRD